VETLFEQKFQIEAFRVLPRARNLEPDWDLRTTEAMKMGAVLYEDSVSGNAGMWDGASQYSTW
jgi:hypothetical protein